MVKKHVLFSLAAALISVIVFFSCTGMYGNMILRDRSAAPKYFTVSFDSNGGTGGHDEPVIAFLQQMLPDLPSEAPVRSGFYFAGYYDNHDGGTQYYNKNLKAAAAWDKPHDALLYAGWSQVLLHDITFYSNNGSGEEYKQSVPEYKTITLPPNPFLNPDFYFTGWNTEADGSGSAYLSDSAFTVETSGVSLYAQWQAVDRTFTVTFHANGGDGTLDPQNFKSGEEKKLSANSFNKNGYYFAGWALAPDAVKTDYADKATFSTAANVTLYARWVSAFNESNYENFAKSGDPFEIETAEQLKDIAKLANSGKTFAGLTVMLKNDIDFGEGTEPNFDGIATGVRNLVGVAFVPMFWGTFDGQGFVIQNMRLEAQEKESIGFIGNAEKDSVIKNLGIDSSSTVIGKTHVGGIVGSSAGTIENCYNGASVTAQSNSAGGIAGAVFFGSKIKKSYNIGKISGQSLIGGIAGYRMGGEISDTYFLEGTAGKAIEGFSVPGALLTARDFAEQTSFSGFDFGTVWEMKTFTDSAVSGASSRPVLRQK